MTIFLLLNNAILKSSGLSSETVIRWKKVFNIFSTTKPKFNQKVHRNLGTSVTYLLIYNVIFAFYAFIAELADSGHIKKFSIFKSKHDWRFDKIFLVMKCKLKFYLK